ncbi:hypothetical protein EDC40_10793 [Aminobacter aminovorans]|uniref:Uncharacterized protein n=1 Tax=Aminobacter aminovorans TaxID=83263 RepID=A0A381IIW7_AMIAI|nr:hypothetical protein EDC40_10793 [Aminobacter aminovorans]SUY28022.1 Uncharacterised protein [Aminobacter aminovorans]
MAFIRLTRLPDHVDVHLHYRHVVAVSTVDGNTFIRTTATNSDGNGHSVSVQETAENVIALLEAEERRRL